MVNALLRVNDYSSYNELRQGGKAHDVSTFPFYYQSQFSLCANFSWPFILKKSSNISPGLNFCCAFRRSFFSVCLNTFHFLSHLCLFLPSPIPTSSPLLPAQQRGKVVKFSQSIRPKQPKVHTQPKESVHSIISSFLQHACILKGMRR